MVVRSARALVCGEQERQDVMNNLRLSPPPTVDDLLEHAGSVPSPGNGANSALAAVNRTFDDAILTESLLEMIE